MGNRKKLLLLWILLAQPIVMAVWVIGAMLALRIQELIMITLIIFLIHSCLACYLYYYSDKILLRWYHAKELPYEKSPLSTIVHQLAIKAGIPAPRVYIAESAMPNVFATGRSEEHASIVVTNALIDLLSNEELEAVLAHELVHVKYRDMMLGSVIAIISGVLTALATVAFWGSMLIGFGHKKDPAPNLIKFFVTSLVAPVAALIIQLMVSPSREYQADAESVRLAGEPSKLVGALEKLEKRLGSNTFDVNPSHVHLFLMNPLHDDDFRVLGFRLPTYHPLFRSHPSTRSRISTLHFFE